MTNTGTALTGNLDAWIARFLGFLDLGGPVVAVLMAMSIFALAVTLLKLYQFRAVRIGDRSYIEPALSRFAAGETSQALAVLNSARNPIARVMETGILGESRASVSAETVREEVTRVANLYLVRLRSYLRGLEVIGTLSPLLGLFGTVLGMIDAFQQLESVGNQVNPGRPVARHLGGAADHAVGPHRAAIPTVAVATWLERRVDRLAADMEDAATRVFTIRLSAGAEQHETQSPGQPEPAHSG